MAVRLSVVALLCALALSGCFASVPSVPPADLAVPWGPADLGRCTEGGYVSLFRHGTFPDIVPPPWTPADIRGETGDPRRGTGGAEMEGPTTGLWHITVTCDAATRDDGTAIGPLWWSYVGIRVEPPPWDDGTVRRHFLVGEISVSDPALAQTMASATGRPIANASDGLVEWSQQGDIQLLRTRILDDVHGSFETTGAVRALHDKPTGTTRIWLLDSLGHDAETGNRFAPVPVDFHDRALASSVVWGVRENVVTFHHRETDGRLAHAEYMGAFYAATDFDRSLAIADPPLGIILNRSWAH